jgi:two-component system, OmpR family, response regulator
MRILLVEDDTNIAAAIERGLQAEGFTVDLAFDGIDGLARAADNSYDVCVLDIMLPGIDGYEVCARMRAAGNRVPVLMLTAKAGDLDEAHGLNTGADDFLSKPFSFVVLLARLRALIRRGTQERPGILHVGDLRLEPATRQVWRAESLIDLTPRQFALLELLMRRAGEVLPKSQILDHVWGGAFDGSPNIVEVYVRQLRQRIDEPFGRNSLQTVRLVGYRLASDGG